MTDKLKTYRNKRNFRETNEPKGDNQKTGKQLRYVIQRHAASRLHYDFRLEMDGVLKSWAVPKGPSLNPSDKRLAMMVEDHPYDYRTFEGSIPEGNYGAGEVEIWDEGTYTAEGDISEREQEKTLLQQLKKGDLKVVLKGKKLKGSFALVQMKTADQGNAWLLIKHKDKYAVDEHYDAETFTKKTSKVSRLLQEKAATKSVKKSPVKKSVQKESANRKAVVKKSVKSASKKNDSVTPKRAAKKKEIITKSMRSYGPRGRKFSEYVKPMLATAAETYSEDVDWVFEMKWDGYRAVAECFPDFRLYSRNGLDYTPLYEPIVKALQQQPHEMIIDGEIVVYDSNNHVSFQWLQQWQQSKKGKLVYHVFDLLWLNGHDTTSLNLLERKELLKEALQEGAHIQYSAHVHDGAQLFREVQLQGWEGMMAKDSESVYNKGTRSRSWLKIKHRLTEEVVIAGYTAPSGSRKYFGALLLGQYQDGVLIYSGHTGSGFNQDLLKDMYKQMQPLIQPQSPFEKTPRTNAKATWLQPKLVATIAYTEQTANGHFRHPVFIGLRPDKDVEDVMEQPLLISKNKVMEKDQNERQVKVNNKKLTFTNLGKIYWPEEKITKGDLIDYYRNMSKWILPYLKDRPQNLHRFPDGIQGSGFYHKDAAEQAPSWVKSFSQYSESAEKTVDYIVCNNEATLLYLANLGCIEMNPWNSKVQHIEQPTYLIIDLDPSDGNTFEDVIEAAQATHQVLEEINVTSYCKTSGASGLHVYIPMGNRYDYEQVKTFAHLIAMRVNEILPDTTTLERSLKKRSKKKVYLDYLQNRSGQTIASAYSVRPKTGATVSTPLEWKEVKKGLSPEQFNIHNIFGRLEKKGDLFQPVLGKGIALQKILNQWDK